MSVSAVVSNGSFKFHLAPAAAELHRHGALERLITGAYPGAGARAFSRVPGLGALPAFLRLLDRAEQLPDAVVDSSWLPEAVVQAGRRIARLSNAPGLALAAESAAMKLYAAQAGRTLAQSNADIYHYRSGYGRGSVAVAKARGMLALCDHSIADPRLIDHLVSHHGQWPDAPIDRSRAMPAATAAQRFWRDLAEDIDAADHVVVNSEFVKRSMVCMGRDPTRIEVVPLGVDDRFLKAVARRSAAATGALAKRPMRLMFAGGLVARKGFEVLVAALQTMDGPAWSLEVAGGADAAVLDRHRAFFADPRVRYLGTLPRAQLAERLSQADVFVFPSLAEGSARVVFEAMAAGCFIVATENSGSILEEGIHGFVIEAGSAADTARRLRQAIAAPLLVAALGRANQRLVFARYRQVDYGQALLALYRRLLPAAQVPADVRSPVADALTAEET